MIIDIREEQEEKVTGIKFDGTDDYISWDIDGIVFNQKSHDGDNEKFLCFYQDVDNFIAALHKAKELAGK